MSDKPITRTEQYLAYAAGDHTINLPEPITRMDRYLYALCMAGGSGATQEQIEQAVADYLEENPVTGGSEWRHIRTVTIPEDASLDTSGVAFLEMTESGTTDYVFAFDTDENGKPFSVTELFIFYNYATSSTNSSGILASIKATPGEIHGKYCISLPCPTSVNGNKTYGWCKTEVIGSKCIASGAWNGGGGTNAIQGTRSNTASAVEFTKGCINAISLQYGSGSQIGFCAGSTFEIYGR